MNVNPDKPGSDAQANPYPQGRWTPRTTTTKRVTELRTATLQSLFCYDEESTLVQDAARRLDLLLAAAAGAPAVKDCPMPEAA